jgi:hypothetical protein
MTQLLDIEKELSGPNGQAAMEGYDQILVNLDERLARNLREGLPPDEYTAAEELKKAVLLARKLLRLEVRDRQQDSQ